MKKNITVILILGLFATFKSYSQYDPQYAECKTKTNAGVTYAIVKLIRKDNRIKAKYFASKNYDGTSVYERYNLWAANKNVVAVSSGTYMTSCDVKYAFPVGLCIDNGSVVNQNLSDKLDGLIIVQATGGIVASNLKVGDLSILYPDGTKKIVDIRNNAYQRAEFIKWAKDQQATVFQTHLLVFKDQIIVGSDNSSQNIAKRRFLAVCRVGADVVHYIINLPSQTTLYEGCRNVYNYLKTYENINEVIYMINLDTGCQNVYKVFNRSGIESGDSNFQGDTSITSAANLLVYYYE